MHRIAAAGCAALLALLVAACTRETDGRSIADRTSTPTPSPAITATEVADGVQETTPPPPETDDVELTAKDVKLKVKTLSKDCFGSAGCNLEVRVDLDELPADTPTDLSFEVTYELRGGNDGASTGTISVEDGKYSPNEEFLQTASSSKKVTAVVTDVEMTG